MSEIRALLDQSVINKLGHTLSKREEESNQVQNTEYHCGETLKADVVLRVCVRLELLHPIQ